MSVPKAFSMPGGWLHQINNLNRNPGATVGRSDGNAGNKASTFDAASRFLSR